MSARSEGCDSRCAFCLFSMGDPVRAIEDNHKTILHPIWSREHFYPDGKLSGKRIVWAAGVYVCGMIGYTAETLFVNIILALGNTLAFLVSLCRCDKQWIKERGVVCLDSWIALGIGIVGMFVPPLAYRLDAAAMETMQGFVRTDED